MNDNSQTTQKMPPLPDGVIPIDLRMLRFSDIMRYIFFNPKLGWALCSIKPFLCTSLVVMILLCGFGSCVITMSSSLTNNAGDIRRGIDFLVETAGEVRFTGNGKLEWDEAADEQLPVAGRLNHLRMDITKSLPHGAEADAITHGTDDVGIIVSHNGVRFWQKSLDAENGVLNIDFPDDRVRSMLKNKWYGQNDADAQMTPLNSQTAPIYYRLFFMTFFFVLWLTNFVGMLKLVFSAALCVGFITFLFNGKRVFSGYCGVISLGINTLIPPTLAACIYTAAGFTNDFSAIMPILFIVYMVYAMIEGRNGKLMAGLPRK